MPKSETTDIGVQIKERWRQRNGRRQTQRMNVALRRILGRMNLRTDASAADRLRMVLRR